MAFQFIHVSTFSIKTGGKGIAAEAGRKPDNSRHIENPLPPVHLVGTSTDDAWSEIVRRKENTKVSIVDKNGVTQQRKLRSDQLVMLAAVASWPVPTLEQDQDDPLFKEWINDTLKFFEQQHGKALVAVLHLDETHPHIHYIASPDLESGQRMHDIHPGEHAKQNLGGRKAKKIDKKQAFTGAMRKYQDDFYEKVSVRFAHARLGPRRPRYAQSEWRAREAENKRMSESIRQSEKRDVDFQVKAEKLDMRWSALRAQMTRHSSSVSYDKERIKSLIIKQENTVEAIKKREKSLDNRAENLEKREQKAETIIRENSGFYGRALSVATFGAKGVDKRVREAREAAKIEYLGVIASAEESLKKAKRIASMRKSKINDIESDFAKSKKSLKESKSEIQDLKNEVAGMQELLSLQRTETLLLKGDISTFQKNNRVISAHLDSLKASLEDSDIDKAKRIIDRADKQINVLPKNRNFENPRNEKSVNIDNSTIKNDFSPSITK
jgi:hypothetical protein